MKLDRNINPNGEGKYALVNLRKFRELKQDLITTCELRDAIHLLNQAGILTYGSESPDQQFFVLKYGDKLAACALRVYANEARLVADALLMVGQKELSHSMSEYANDIQLEAQRAKESGCRLPT